MTEPTEQELAILGEDMQAPDLVGKIIGFRCFHDAEIFPPRLDQWYPGVNTAQCGRAPQSQESEEDKRAPILWQWSKPPPGRHTAPQLNCSCGLYAFSDPKHLQAYYGNIIAVVRGWGKMCVAENGWRAQHAEVIALCHHKAGVRELQEVARRFNVPIIAFENLREWAEQQEGTLLPKSLSVEKLAENPTMLTGMAETTKTVRPVTGHHTLQHGIGATVIMATLTGVLLGSLLITGWIGFSILLIVAVMVVFMADSA